jgi:hypothetical protein
MDQLTIFQDRIQEIKDKKKSFLSKYINKKSKFQYNIIKKRPKYILKSTNDFEYIKKLIFELKDCEQIHLMSSAFDSPSIIYAVSKLENIKEIVCSTWAITERGLQMFDEVKAETWLLLDKTYSYKWIFESGAIEYLKQVHLKFTENHSKVILIKTTENFYTFAGSMNLSNNPRIENLVISKDKEIYQFYEQAIKKEFE